MNFAACSVNAGASEAPVQSPGAIAQTGNPLDVALDGDGFLAVTAPQGVRYTRAGDLRLDAEGRLVTSSGLAVRARGGGEIHVPRATASVSFDADGTVRGDGKELGQLELVRLPEGALTREGDGLFAAAPGTAIAEAEDLRVTPGALEMSNFNVVRGMVELVQVSRTYEALHRMIETYRQIDDRTARDVGAPK